MTNLGEGNVKIDVTPAECNTTIRLKQNSLVNIILSIMFIT